MAGHRPRRGGAARVPAGGDRADRGAGRRWRGGGGGAHGGGAERGGPQAAQGGRGRRRAVPRPAELVRRVRGSAHATPRDALPARPGRPGGSGEPARPGPRPTRPARGASATSRWRGAPQSDPWAGRPPEPARALGGARCRGSGHLRPRHGPRARLLHGIRIRGLRPRRGLHARRRRPLRRADRPFRPRPARVRDRARRAAGPPGAGRRGRARREGAARMNDRLTIAVPRGALFGGTLDLLDRLGVDTSEVRSNDRRLLFADVGIVTMRPSDVPTYVEHGSADIGITGKDVLLEQSQRKVYELLDLGYGHCEMVVAAPDGGDPIGDALRRLGRVRIATKYPRVAGEHFQATGRQAEIVEVKGSVELAPLTGLVDGIVDLTATGKTLAENN